MIISYHPRAVKSRSHHSQVLRALPGLKEILSLPPILCASDDHVMYCPEKVSR